MISLYRSLYPPQAPVHRGTWAVQTYFQPINNKLFFFLLLWLFYTVEP